MQEVDTKPACQKLWYVTRSDTDKEGEASKALYVVPSLQLVEHQQHLQGDFRICLELPFSRAGVLKPSEPAMLLKIIEDPKGPSFVWTTSGDIFHIES